MSSTFVQYVQLIVSVFGSVLLPVIILMLSRHNAKQGERREEIIVMVKALSTKVDRLEAKTDAHIVWHLNGG